MPLFISIAKLTEAKIRAKMECKGLKQIEAKNLQAANTIQSIFEAPKIMTIFQGI